jgi:hypothetical protein
MFKVGQKVVCVDDKIYAPDIENHNKKFPNWIKQDETYTIRACTQTPRGWGVLVKELKNPFLLIPDYHGKAEGRFHADRFRAMQTDEEFVEEVIKQVKEEEVEEPVEA